MRGGLTIVVARVRGRGSGDAGGGWGGYRRGMIQIILIIDLIKGEGVIQQPEPLVLMVC